MTYALELSESEKQNPAKTIQKYEGLLRWSNLADQPESIQIFRRKLFLARNLYKENLYWEAYSE